MSGPVVTCVLSTHKTLSSVLSAKQRNLKEKVELANQELQTVSRGNHQKHEHGTMGCKGACLMIGKEQERFLRGEIACGES